MQNFSYNCQYFSLKIAQKKHTSNIVFTISPSFVTTKMAPQTLSILKSNLPSVLRTKCFNDKNLSFEKEVVKTEIGHLFEHIFIENLSLLKIQNGFDYAEFNGRTSWNWNKEETGIFHIFIDAGKEDDAYFFEALKESILLTNSVIESSLSIYDFEQNKNGQPVMATRSL